MRVGFSIHRATQWRWMRALAAIVLPLVELMRQRVMQSRVRGSMRRPVPCFAPNSAGPAALPVRPVRRSAQPYVCFAFASHKTEENVRRIVGSYEGYLQSDAYICYELIAAASEKIVSSQWVAGLTRVASSSR